MAKRLGGPPSAWRSDLQAGVIWNSPIADLLTIVRPVSNFKRYHYPQLQRRLGGRFCVASLSPSHPARCFAGRRPR